MTYSLLVEENGKKVWTPMYDGDPEDARQHRDRIGAEEARMYQNGRYLGVVK